jgi:hypothetical protein
MNWFGGESWACFQVGGEGDQLAIFLAELLPEDVCTTMYAAQYPNRTAQQVPLMIFRSTVFCCDYFAGA